MEAIDGHGEVDAIIGNLSVIAVEEVGPLEVAKVSPNSLTYREESLITVVPVSPIGTPAPH